MLRARDSRESPAEKRLAREAVWKAWKGLLSHIKKTKNKKQKNKNKTKPDSS